MAVLLKAKVPRIPCPVLAASPAVDFVLAFALAVERVLEVLEGLLYVPEETSVGMEEQAHSQSEEKEEGAESPALASAELVH